MQVGRVQFLRDRQIALLSQHVAEGAIDGFLGRAGDAAGRLQLAVPDCDRHLDAVHPDGAVRANRRGVDASRRERIGRDQVAAALLRHADEALFAGVQISVAEGRVVVLKGAHLLELFLHPAPAFHGELEQFRQLLLGCLAVRIDDLHQARNGAFHGLAVAGHQVRAHGEVAVGDFGKIVPAQLAERLSHVVDHKAIVVGEHVVAHLRHFPAWQVEVQTIDESHVVAEEGYARLAGRRLLAPLEGPGLAVGLHGGDDLFGHLLEVCDLVEAHDVPDLHQAF